MSKTLAQPVRSVEYLGGRAATLLDGKNVVLIHGFNEYCAILFHKGTLQLKTTVKAYVREAITIERAGLKVEFKKTEDFELPEEFESKLAKNKKL